MKSKQIIRLVGLFALLITAVLIDFAYYHIGFDTEITLSSGFNQFLIDFRGLLLVVFYAAFFVVGASLISEENPSGLQSWIILVAGLVIVFLVGVLPYGGNEIFRFIRAQIFLFDQTHLKLVFHYGPMLTAMGLVQLVKTLLHKKK